MEDINEDGWTYCDETTTTTTTTNPQTTTTTTTTCDPEWNEGKTSCEHDDVPSDMYSGCTDRDKYEANRRNMCHDDVLAYSTALLLQIILMVFTHMNTDKFFRSGKQILDSVFIRQVVDD